MTRSLPASDLERYRNAHNAEAAVVLYERADNCLHCCHDFALYMSDLRN
jgi:hypothetical protein